MVAVAAARAVFAVSGVYPDIKWTLTMVSHSAIFATVDENGIIAEFTDDNEIKLSNHAQD